MLNSNTVYLKKASRIISDEIGILTSICTLPRMHSDPKLIGYGIWPCETSVLGGLKYGGRSSGCAYSWDQAILTTVGEVVERYCPAFYNTTDFIKSSYKNLGKKAVHPSEIALFHPKQYEGLSFPFVPFTEDLEQHWVPCYSLISGEEVYYPGSLIYLPWVEEEEWIALSTSTGLAAHTDFYKAILTGLFESIERDSFVITWMQGLVPPKIKIDRKLRKFINEYYPNNLEFHLFDMTYDLGVPSILGICFGESDIGKFIAVGTAARGTYKEAIKKAIMEIGQTVGYFRFALENQRDWNPQSFEELRSFEEHSVFYAKRKDLWHIFDKFKNAVPSKDIDFDEKENNNPILEIRKILEMFKGKNYDVLVKYLSTPDIRDTGYHSVKVIVPPLIQMAGNYIQYFSGGKRLYEVPKLFGYEAKDYDNLNKYPHPCP